MKNRAPSHLSREAKKIWKSLLDEYGITDTAGLKILESALESYDRAKSAREAIDLNGLVVIDKAGQVKPNPLIPCERDARAAFLAGLKALNLDLEPLRDKPGRPGGR